MIYPIILTTTYGIVISLIWPEFRKKIREKVTSTRIFFFFLRKIKKYHDAYAIITAPLYFCLGLVSGIILILIIKVYFSPLFLDYLFNIFKIKSVLKIFTYGFLIFLSGAMIILTINAMLSRKIIECLLRGDDFAKIFRSTWIEDYLNSSVKILLFSMLLSVCSEEFFFRAVLTLAIYYFIEEQMLIKIIVASIVSTSLFVLHQLRFLHTKLQAMLLTPAAIVIGLLNSLALLFGASFWSIVLAHYLYVVFFFIHMQRSSVSISVPSIIFSGI